MRKLAADTSVIVPAVFEGHPHHESSLALMQRSRRREVHLSISMHAIAETYATLTAKAPHLSVPPQAAAELIRDLLSYVEVIDVGGHEYMEMIVMAADRGLCSGVVYDAIHYAAATKAQAERLLTNNVRDFYRLCTAPGFVCRPDALPE